MHSRLALVVEIGLLVLSGGVPGPGVAQPVVVEGLVETPNGMGIPYANVQVAGTMDGPATNEQGRFRTRRTGRVILRTSAVGYEGAQRRRRLAAGDTVRVPFILASSRVRLDEGMADAWALLAGVYDRRMVLNPMQGMFLGPDAGEAIERAKKLDPDNPRVWIIDGAQDFFTDRSIPVAMDLPGLT